MCGCINIRTREPIHLLRGDMNRLAWTGATCEAAAIHCNTLQHKCITGRHEQTCMNKLSYAYIHTPTHIYIYYSLQSDFLSHTTHLYIYSRKRAYSHTRPYLCTHIYPVFTAQRSLFTQEKSIYIFKQESLFSLENRSIYAHIHISYSPHRDPFSHTTHLYTYSYKRAYSHKRISLYTHTYISSIHPTEIPFRTKTHPYMSSHKRAYSCKRPYLYMHTYISNSHHSEIPLRTRHIYIHIHTRTPILTGDHIYIRTHAYLIFTPQRSLFTQDTSNYILQKRHPYRVAKTHRMP